MSEKYADKYSGDEDELKDYTIEAINGVYQAKRQKQINELEAAYRQSLRELERSRENVNAQYSAGRNELAASYERARKNMNERAAASGMNSGAGTQAALMQRSMYQRDSGALDRQRIAAMSDADMKQAELEDSYRQRVSSAIEENDYQRASALLQEYKDAYGRDLKKAGTLASYGDFSAYGKLYGDDTAAGMREAWIASNPDLAYSLGSINAEQYRHLTGRYPNR